MGQLSSCSKIPGSRKHTSRSDSRCVPSASRTSVDYLSSPAGGKGAPFETLLLSGTIGRLVVRNRIVMPAMATNLAAQDGSVTDRLVDYYESRARGGVGLIVVEVTNVHHPIGRTVSRQIAIDDDRFIPGLARLATAIRSRGAAAFVQLHHAGGRARTRMTGVQPVGPSPVAQTGYDLPRELSTLEIADLVSRFANAALRAQHAGFDGVELHAAHGYLVSQFLSPASNKRVDQYGGSLANRARFLLEIVGAVRDMVGVRFPIICRISAQEYGLPGGITLTEAAATARLIHQAGVDAIHVTAWPTPAFRFPPMDEPPGNMIHLAAAIKQSVTCPIIAVGRLTLEAANEALLSKSTDFVAMGRALIVDPELPAKLASHRVEDITPCIGCLRCHATLGNHGNDDGDVECTVNPRVGHEHATEVHLARKPKSVLVIGGGPAGMMAGITAARRGHLVTLVEREKQLGGQLNLAVVAPHKQQLALVLKHMTGQLAQLPIKVSLGMEITATEVLRMDPDAVVVATGARPIVQTGFHPGGNQLMTAWDVLSRKSQPGERVVIIGGQLTACETADFLACRGRQVTILGRRRPIASEIEPDYARRCLVQRLQDAAVQLEENVTVDLVTSKGVRCTRAGEVVSFPADSVVLAIGSLPVSDFARALGGRVRHLFTAGDCLSPRTVAAAIREGFSVGGRV